MMEIAHFMRLLHLSHWLGKKEILATLSEFSGEYFNSQRTTKIPRVRWGLITSIAKLRSALLLYLWGENSVRSI